MGRMLVEAITDTEASCVLAAAVDRPGSSLVGTDVGQLLGLEALGVRVTDDLLSVVSAIDVLIDFTVPEATLAHAQPDSLTIKVNGCIRSPQNSQSADLPILRQV
jgi:4-hydroxy-tetrahydrodipicolinate reductase